VSSSNSTAESRRFLVRGRVQQVGFRAATRRRALQLGLEGFAANLPDGRVSVQVRGPAVAVAQLREWLDHGPALARVEEVSEVESVACSDTGFVVR